MFVKILNNTIVKFPYSFADLQQENPYSNFGSNTDICYLYSSTEDAIKTGCQIQSVYILDQPEYDISQKKIVHQSSPQLVNNTWQLGWDIIDLTTNEKNELNFKQKIKIREERNRLLQETDWTQLKDSPLDITKQNEFLEYRKLLRDISNQPSFPWNIIWPNKPI